MTTSIIIDPNVRVRGNGTYAGLEDVDGLIDVGDTVEVREPEAGLVGIGRVTEIDQSTRLVYISVDWASLSEKAPPALLVPADSSTCVIHPGSGRLAPVEPNDRPVPPGPDQPDDRAATAWSAQLNGRPGDLEELAALFSTDKVICTSQTDGSFTLVVPGFDDATDVTQVKSAAIALLRRLNAVVSLTHSETYSFVELTGSFKNGDDAPQIPAIGAVSATCRVTGVCTVHGSFVQAPPPPSEQAWIALAARDPNVRQVLDLLGSRGDLDWLTLNKIREVVEYDVGGKGESLRQLKWATKSQLSEFGAGANNPAVSGDAARHARQPAGTPKKWMTLDAARPFIHHLVRSWLEWKLRGPEQAT